ncbi:MAG: hypothetical protein HN344_05475, partial [Gammaproteobacteria bacterium]|nr:hypothetical protein [Gammaproteobacteria bacterium]
AGVPAQKILLAGFSQGGVIALHAALRYPQALAGVMALSTYLPCVEKIPEARDPALAVFFAHGEYDPVVPYHEGERAHHTLSKLGYLSQWHSYPMEHSVCNEEITDLSHFIKHASRLSATKSNPGFCAPELPSTG